MNRSGLTRTRIRVIRVNFKGYQGKFQGKANIVELGGNSSYPSKNDVKVG